MKLSEICFNIVFDVAKHEFKILCLIISSLEVIQIDMILPVKLIKRVLSLVRIVFILKKEKARIDIFIDGYKLH
jgi:hypothetical protein